MFVINFIGFAIFHDDKNNFEVLFLPINYRLIDRNWSAVEITIFWSSIWCIKIIKCSICIM